MGLNLLVWQTDEIHNNKNNFHYFLTKLLLKNVFFYKFVKSNINIYKTFFC